MLLLLSPAKIQNFKPQNKIPVYTQPEFLEEAESLIEQIRSISVIHLSRLLDVNLKLAQLNAERHSIWHRPFTPENARQAVLFYNGEVFRGLDAKTLSLEDIDYLQSHLRILSGLYGILRPLDLVQPYRLEISSKLITDQGKDLYAFWGDRITQAIRQALSESGEPNILLNLASAEYFKCVNTTLLNARVIDFEFLDSKNGEYKPIIIYIKKARGMMVRYIVQNRIEDVEELKGFDCEGYWYSPQLSTDQKMVFIR